MINLALLVAILAGLVFAAAVLTKTPRADRDWKPALARVPVFEETAPGRYALPQLRDYEFAPGGKPSPGWRAVELQTDHLKEMWFFVEPFPANAMFAHSFLSFVFEDEAGEQKAVAVSIEARMEKEESYSPVRGALRNYELMYVWSTERDIMTRIAVGLDHTLYAYKLDLTPEQAQKLFEYFVRRTNALAEQPRFYNTLHSNCTNELAKAVNEAFPRALPWHRSWVMTGRSAKWLHKLGFISHAGGMSYKDLTAQSDIREIVHAHKRAEDFSAAWRQAFGAAASPEDA